jgi:inosine-uridine nucleoside N-ribohydrolase
MDMGADDVLAVAMLLREPSVDVMAVTISGTGLTHCAAGLRNLASLLALFEVDVPIGCGRDDPGDDGMAFPSSWRQSTDSFSGVDVVPATGSGDWGSAVDVLAGAISGAEQPVWVFESGPWTNLEDLIAEHAELIPKIHAIHAMAGAIEVAGNVAPDSRAEWNVRADPSALDAVLPTGIPITLIPLDATNQVPLDASFVSDLGTDSDAAGAAFARELFSRNPFLLQADQYLWDELAAASLVDPSLVQLTELTVTVDLAGDPGALETGPAGQPALVALSADAARARAHVIASLERGAPTTRIRSVLGELTFRWNGTECARVSGEASLRGSYDVTFENTDEGAVVLYLAVVREGHTWQDLIDFFANATPPVTNIPSWAIALSDLHPTGASGPARVRVPAGAFGPICTLGSGADQRYVAGDPIDITAEDDK